MATSSGSGTRRGSLASPVSAALALGFTVAICVPLRTLAANRAEFQFGFLAIAPRLLGVAAAIAVVAGLLSLVVPSRWRHRMSAAVLAVALAVWVQSSFLVWDYGVFDGKRIAWSDFSWHGWFDLVVWGVLLVAAVLLASRLRRHLTWLAAGFLVLQLGSSLAEAWLSDRDILTREPPAASGAFEAITEVSSGQNVVHVLLDAFQTDIFLEIVSDDGLEPDFAGFTVFRDNLSACAWTQLCLPTIFGGEVFDGSTTTTEFIRRATQERSFTNLLYQQGFTVNLVPFIAMEDTPHTNYLMSPRSYGKSRRELIQEEQAHLLDVSLFRMSPHRGRRWIFNDGNWRVGSLSEPPTTRSFHQKAFFGDYVDALRPAAPTPAYHFLHLFPPHLPYVTNPDGSFAGQTLPDTRENYKVEARYILRRFVDLLSRLRQLGLYDDALILLQGDHGSTHPPRFDGVEVPIRRDGYAGLLAVKPPGAAAPMSISDAPTSHADIPATVLSLLALPGPDRGPSAFSLDVDTPRERIFFEPIWEDNQIDLFRVQGSVHADSSWSPPQRRPIGQGRGAYRWGESIQFGMDGNSGLYLDRGWSFPDEGFIWTNGTRSTLRATVQPPRGDVDLSIWLRAFLIPNRHPRQRLTISANGTAVGEWTLVDHREPLTTSIPNDLLQSEELRLELHFPDARRPSDLGLNDDRRQLGASVRHLRLVDTGITASPR